MKGIVGLLCAVGGGWIGWWAFNKATTGNDFYNWIWPIALIICVFGILLILTRIKKWMHD